MNIVVCIKPVPDPRGGTSSRSIRGPCCSAAPRCRRSSTRSTATPSSRPSPCEATRGGTVTVVTMAPPEAEEQLAEALAMGCDRAFLLTDAAFAGADTLATARCLAAAIRKIGRFDLVFCGGYSLDGSTSQVGPQLAELLGMPDLTHVTALTLDGGTLRARCATEGGETVYECDSAGARHLRQGGERAAPAEHGRHHEGGRASGVTAGRPRTSACAPDEVGLGGSPTQMLNIFTRPSPARARSSRARRTRWRPRCWRD